MADEYSLIKFNCSNFFAVLMNSRPFQPISTLLIKLVESIIEAEPTPDEKMLQEVRWIYENTHKEVEENLAIIELVVFKNLNGGLSRELEIGDKTFSLTQLYKYLDEVSKELSTIVISIAKKYSFDIPMLQMGGGGTQTIEI